MPMFIGSQSFISLPSFMFVSAVISEIRELKEKKEKNSEIDYFQFNTFHLIYPFFKPEVPFEHMYRFNLLEVPYTTNDHQDFLKYTIMLGHPYTV